MMSDRRTGLGGAITAVGEPLSGAAIVAGPIIGGLAAAAGLLLLERGGANGYPFASAAALFGVGWLLLADRGAWIKGGAVAALLAAIFLPAFMQIGPFIEAGASGATFVGWVGLPLATFFALVLAKAALRPGAAFGYTTIFFESVTLPVVLAGAAVCGGLGLLVVFGWSALLGALKIAPLTRILGSPLVAATFIGAVGGLAIVSIRRQEAFLNAVRYALLFSARVALPVAAALLVTLLAMILLSGASFFERPYPAATLLTAGLVAAAIFNGVYQNGAGAPPPLWLRLSALVTLASLPAIAALAGWALSIRIAEYGVTPLRAVGLAFSGLLMAQAAIGLVGLISEVNWRAKVWMGAIAPLNVGLAALWAAALFALALPGVNAWQTSAAMQEARLRAGVVRPEAFDFAFLGDSLGDPGRAALARLAEAYREAQFAAAQGPAPFGAGDAAASADQYEALRALSLNPEPVAETNSDADNVETPD